VNNKTNDVEHFVEERDDYKYRMEVMKVFDIYLGRNATPEEINKYAVQTNEHDILLSILKDFNINASAIDQSKIVQYNGLDVPVVQEESETQPKFDALSKTLDHFNQEDNIQIPLSSYLEFKKKMNDLVSQVDKINKDLLDHQVLVADLSR
jgi:hypothetical protein